MSQGTTGSGEAPPIAINVTNATTATTTGPAPKISRGRLNKPQSQATAVGALLFTSAGMNMAMGLGWAENALYAWTNHFCYSWFIGVIIGAVVSVPFSHFMTAKKKWIMATSAFIILFEGILFAGVPRDYDTLLAARYLNGIAIGLMAVPFLIHASEIAVDSYRGSCLMTEQYSISFGIGIQMIYSSFWPATVDFPANRFHGILDIVYSILTLVFISFFTESPIDFIRKGDDMAALDCLARLQNPKIVNANTHARLEQQKYYYQEQNYATVEKCVKKSLVPLLKMLVFRSALLAFSYNLPLNITLKYSVLLNGDIWAGTVAGVCRIVGVFLAFIMVDHAPRKIPSTISAIILGGLLIGQGTLFKDIYNILNWRGINTAMALYIVIQAFGGFYSSYTSVYLAEAFPLKVKPYFMTFCVIMEAVIQIIFIQTISLRIGNNLLIQGIITLVAGIAFFFVMPETKNSSLAEAQEGYSKLLNFKRK
ncbi:uncharacterized protein LOC101889937 [Musca domestica]|uniref:Uncharacterized protein LOC101889937 n=1 Tax=Musca domestica TaxID=7370 RepID=A0A1I8MGU7_MUSDO|nr:uncharacterized protein LOC101889937 [Musca domestica]